VEQEHRIVRRRKLSDKHNQTIKDHQSYADGVLMWTRVSRSSTFVRMTLIDPAAPAQNMLPAGNVDVAGLSVAGLSIGGILNGHLGKCPFRIAQWTLK